MNKEKCFITGVTGQDGAYAAKKLIEEGYEVWGARRRGSNNDVWRLEKLNILNKVNLVECQITETQNIIEILMHVTPRYIYHFAADSFVADSFKYPVHSMNVNAIGTLNLLEAIRLITPEAKMILASSSEIYGKNDFICTEDSMFNPQNPYAISKLTAFNFVKMYREKHKINCGSAILFNHESPLRGGAFVTKKIIENLVRIERNGGEYFTLGNLDSKRDWGYAVDYVDACIKIVESDKVDDYVVSSGILHTVRDFLRIAAIKIGFNPQFEGEGENEICYDKNTGKLLAKVSSKYYRSNETKGLVGCSDKLIKNIGWSGTCNIEKLIDLMIAGEYEY